MARFALTLFLLLAFSAKAAETVQVVVYGATPGGIAAALAAAKDGESVLLIEPSMRIGGLTTNGLSHPDFRSFPAITGMYFELTKRAEAYYRKTHGANSQQVIDCMKGTHAEPKVNLTLLEEMLAEHKQITLKTKWTLADVKVRGKLGDWRVTSAIFRDPEGNFHTYSASVFIDGSYEGDLMAAAKIPYRVGREGQEEYGESIAPEEGDGQLQGYSFRLIMTQDPTIMVPIKMPAGYKRDDYTAVLPLIESGKIKRVVGVYADTEAIIKAHVPVLPNNKRDMNDVSRGLVRLSLPGEQLGWPEGDARVRKEIYEVHMLWHVGLLYFLQNDPAVPTAMRKDAATWGWCRDEFPENNHLPPQIYVREARRMIGSYVFTQHDTAYAGTDVRTPLRKDAIAMNDFGLNCHGTGLVGSRFGGERAGEFYNQTAPYQVPYGVIVPKEARNVLVPVAISASHVGFNALRWEIAWSAMGQAAGHAAHLAIRAGSFPDVRSVDVTQLQARLHREGVATIYLSDVLPGDPDFEATQWWGILGGWHGLVVRPADFSPKGKQIIGMHHEPVSEHRANLDKVLDDTLGARWAKLAGENGIAVGVLPKPDGKVTRGAWLRAAYNRHLGTLKNN